MSELNDCAANQNKKQDKTRKECKILYITYLFSNEITFFYVSPKTLMYSSSNCSLNVLAENLLYTSLIELHTIKSRGYSEYIQSQCAQYKIQYM